MNDDHAGHGADPAAASDKDAAKRARETARVKAESEGADIRGAGLDPVANAAERAVNPPMTR